MLSCRVIIEHVSADGTRFVSILLDVVCENDVRRFANELSIKITVLSIRRRKCKNRKKKIYIILGYRSSPLERDRSDPSIATSLPVSFRRRLRLFLFPYSASRVNVTKDVIKTRV